MITDSPSVLSSYVLKTLSICVSSHQEKWKFLKNIRVWDVVLHRQWDFVMLAFWFENILSLYFCFEVFLQNIHVMDGVLTAYMRPSSSWKLSFVSLLSWGMHIENINSIYQPTPLYKYDIPLLTHILWTGGMVPWHPVVNTHCPLKCWSDYLLGLYEIARPSASLFSTSVC
jgi:hypothetical protein